jgi:hypothetical protein
MTTSQSDPIGRGYWAAVVLWVLVITPALMGE